MAEYILLPENLVLANPLIFSKSEKKHNKTTSLVIKLTFKILYNKKKRFKRAPKLHCLNFFHP